MDKTESNRMNAKRSTGPRTKNGAQNSSKNAIKHGLSSTKFFLDSEELIEFDMFTKSFLEDLKPEGRMENLLAARIIQNAWRLNRAALIEVDLFNGKARDLRHNNSLHKEIESKMPARGIGDIFKALEVSKGFLSILTKYEAHIERQFYRALHELQRMQISRNGGDVTPPVAIDLQITGSPISLEHLADK